MRKIVCLLLVCILLVGCGNSDSNTVYKSVEDVYIKAGDEAGEKEDKLFQMIGANDGFGFEFKGENVEVYSFDDIDKLNESKEIFASLSDSNFEEYGNILVMTTGDQPFSELLK